MTSYSYVCVISSFIMLMPKPCSNIGIMSLLFVANYFIFGAICSSLIPEKQNIQNKHHTIENQYYDKYNKISHNI